MNYEYYTIKVWGTHCPNNSEPEHKGRKKFEIIVRATSEDLVFDRLTGYSTMYWSAAGQLPKGWTADPQPQVKLRKKLKQWQAESHGYAIYASPTKDE